MKIHNNELLTLSLNIQSIRSKFSELQSILCSLGKESCFFDVICLQESWLSNMDCYDLFQFDGYKLYKKDLDNNCSKHGGLITYIKDSVKVENFEIINNYKSFEGLILNILLNNKKFSVLNLYRPPSNQERNFEQFFNEFIPEITKFTKLKKEFIILGDFNINLLKVNVDKNFSTFFDLMINFHCRPLITFPTRFSEKTATLIDQIYCNSSPTSDSAERFENSDYFQIFQIISRFLYQ